MSWVLVIEDEEDIAEFLRYILENENFTVKTAASLAEARARTRRKYRKVSRPEPTTTLQSPSTSSMS